MTWIITKYLLTAGMVVFISEVAKRSDRLGGFIAALPLMTLLTLVWLYVENQPEEKIANHAYYTFWYVIPTLPIFLIFPYLLPKLGFLMARGGIDRAILPNPNQLIYIKTIPSSKQSMLLAYRK